METEEVHVYMLTVDSCSLLTFPLLVRCCRVEETTRNSKTNSLVYEYTVQSQILIVQDMKQIEPIHVFL